MDLLKTSLTNLKLDLPEIASDNLRLIPISEKHADLLKNLYMDKENVKYLSLSIQEWNGDVEKAKQTIKNIQKDNSECLWVIEKVGKSCGLIGLEEIHFIYKHAELWFLLDKEFQNQGIVTSAVKLLVDYLRANVEIEYLYANVLVPNIPSQKVVRKVGFSEWGTKPGGVLIDNKRIDESFFFLKL